jgi:hypothetical protein
MSAGQKRSGPKTAPELTQPHRNPVTVSTFPDLAATRLEEIQIDWADLPRFLVDDAERKAKDKKGLRLFVAGTFDGSTTPKGSVRHDDGMTSMTALVIDYDAGLLSMAAGAAIFEQHGCTAVLAPTASWSEGFPKWRAVIPLSKPITEDLKARHREFVATVRSWGIPASGETDTLSQSYYFGTPTGKEGTFPAATQVGGGKPLDLLPQAAPRTDSGQARGAHVEDQEMAELLETVSTGRSGVHEAMRRLSMAWIARGVPGPVVKTLLLQALDKWGDASNARWAERRAGVDRLVDGAARRLAQEQWGEDDDGRPLPHPLARFESPGLDEEPPAPDWVLRGFMESGLTMLAGSAGVGKTTGLVPLACCVAGLAKEGPLKQPDWRHVVYITEQLAQARRVMRGYVDAGNADPAEVAQRFRFVKASRLPVDQVCQVRDAYAQFTRIHIGPDGQEHQLLPLVVLDTQGSVIQVDDENSNATISGVVNTLKQEFDAFPIWVVAHVPKALKRADAQSLTVRGGGAWEGESNGVFFFINEGGSRYLVTSKVRAEQTFSELKFDSSVGHLMVQGRNGDELVGIRWNVPAPGSAVARAARREANQAEATANRHRAAILAALADGPLSTAQVKAQVTGRGTDVADALKTMAQAGELTKTDAPRGSHLWAISAGVQP